MYCLKKAFEYMVEERGAREEDVVGARAALVLESRSLAFLLKLSNASEVER